ncbi:MAG: hypothetical protein ACXWYB_08415 [Aeromicrobium sp.]
MPSGPEYPHYPIAHEPPPQSLSQLWLVAAIGFVVGSLIVATVAVVVISRADPLAAFATYIDDPEILHVIEPECGRMTDTVESLIVTGTPKEQAAVIVKQNEAVERFVAAVREIDADVLATDEPTVGWLADWDVLVSLRSVYAAELERGNRPVLELPTDSVGDPINERMDWASEPECVVPDTLLDTDPEVVKGV